MKLFRQIFLSLLFFTSFNAIQAQKIGHIDTQILLKSMPESVAMQVELKKVEQTYTDEYNTQVTAMEAKAKKYQTEAPTQTDIKNQERKTELGGLKQKIQKYIQTAQEEMEKKSVNLLQPIVQKATQAIKDVAVEKEISYVFDSSPGKGLLVFDKGEDILPAVKEKLGIE